MACAAHRHVNQRYQSDSISSIPSPQSNDPTDDYDSDSDEYDDDMYDTDKEEQEKLSRSQPVSEQTQLEEDIDVVFDRLCGDLLSRSGRIEGLESKPAEQESKVDQRDAVDEGDSSTLMDFMRLRKWKDQSQREHIKLQERSEKLVEEMANQKKKSQEYCKALMHEKVALAEQLHGPAKLPLEILLIIAGFIVGNNDFATMVSFSLMSKRIKEETKAVLYETIMVYKLPSASSGHVRQAYLDASCHVKFLYCRRDGLSAKIGKRFPNLRCAVRTAARGDDFDPAADEDLHTSQQAQISIYHPIHLSTVVSLISYSGPPTSEPGAHHRSIQAVSMITLRQNGALLEDRLSMHDPVFENSNIPCFIQTTICESEDSFPETVRELARFVSSKDPAATADYVEGPGKSYRLTLEVDAGFQLDAWLQHLPHFIRRLPNTFICIMIRGETEMTRSEFDEQFMRAISAYRTLWPEIKRTVVELYLDEEGTYGEELFYMNYSTNRWSFDGNHSEDEDGEEFDMKGQLIYDRATRSFRVMAVEVDEEEEMEAVVFDRPLIEDGAFVGE